MVAPGRSVAKRWNPAYWSEPYPSWRFQRRQNQFAAVAYAHTCGWKDSPGKRVLLLRFRQSL